MARETTANRIPRGTVRIPLNCHVVKMAKQVLVRVGENSRPVTIEPGDLLSSDVERLKQSIYKCFDDVLKVDASESILLQIKSEYWNGEFVWKGV